MNGAAIIVRGDAANLALPDESVDLIITSPPYFALRSYRDGDEHYDGQIGSEPTPQDFLEALWACTEEWRRVLKPTGSLWVNLGDKYAGSGGHNNSGISDKSTLRGNGHTGGVGKAGPQKVKATLRSAPDRYNQNSGGIRSKSLMGLPWRYAIGCVDRGWILRAEVVWSKPNGLPESVTDRVRRSHEQFFHFTKQGRYFAAVDEVREAHTGPTFTGKAGVSRDTYELPEKDGMARGPLKMADRDYNPLGKLPGSVWTIPSEPLVIPDEARQRYNLPDHFAAFPQEWPRRIILGWSPLGICVECGEGRVPCVEKRYLSVGDKFAGGTAIAGRHDSGTRMGDGVEATITGYRCACPEPTADTTPAVVLDPFGGTGTVAMVARQLGRIGISNDLSGDYCRLARWRIFESGNGAKSESRMWAERQGVLFG